MLNLYLFQILNGIGLGMLYMQIGRETEARGRGECPRVLTGGRGRGAAAR